MQTPSELETITALDEIAGGQQRDPGVDSGSLWEILNSRTETRRFNDPSNGDQVRWLPISPFEHTGVMCKKSGSGATGCWTYRGRR